MEPDETGTSTLVCGLSTKADYRVVSVLLEDGRRVTRNVHNLVCCAFHGKRPSPKHVASHKDGDSHNNLPHNLMWETQKENLARKSQHGTHDRGLANSRACLTADSLAGVRALLSEGLKHADIAEKYGISRTMVSRVHNKKKYADF